MIQASAESVPFAGFAPVSGDRTASRRDAFIGSPGTSHDLFDRYHVDRTARPLKRAVFQPEPIFRLDLADDNEDVPCMQQAHSKTGCYRVGLPHTFERVLSWLLVKLKCSTQEARAL